MLFGRDTEADANSRGNTRSMFDGDLLVHGDILVGYTPRSPYPRLRRLRCVRRVRWTTPFSRSASIHPVLNNLSS